MCDLKTKFKRWQEWLTGDDINSIKNQIHNMIWDSAVFQSINECRRYAPTNEKGEVELNGVVHQFINKCFFETQAIAIRRLLDKRLDVISLRRLVDDIEKDSHLLTRENILDALGYPYEYEQEKRRISDETFKKGPGPHWMGQDYRRCVTSEYTHSFIDLLAGVESSKRSCNDVVRPQIFEWLKQCLRNCEDIGEFVNKYIAHSATPESRNYRNPPELDITLEQILEAHEIICKTAMFVGLRILGDGVGDVLAIPQYDQFVHFDKAWASEETVKKLYEFWGKYDRQTRDWHHWDWEGDFNKSLSKP
jgi:hypothetical protein